MNLYIEASKVLNGVQDKKGSVKSLVYKSEFLNKKQLYALVCQTLKFGDILQKIVDKTQILKTEKLLKNDTYLAHTLLYDSVFGRGLFRAGKLKQTMKRHKASIHAECERLKIKAGVTNIHDLVTENGFDEKDVDALPRYVRVNILKTNMDAVIKAFESDGWEQVLYLQNYESFVDCIQTLEEYQFIKDLHVPDLLVFPSGTDLHDNRLCNTGEIILQDKASCFPALILSPPEGAFIIDSCAAPGNKTSHLASMIQNKGKIFAFDKSKERMKTLIELTAKAGVTCMETFRQDFCRVDPNDAYFKDAEYVLVDPSCSGSGIVSRLNHVTDDSSSNSKERLKNLAAFQFSILLHALSFPNVRKVIYSTCSIHMEENEEVVDKVMSEMSETFKVKRVMPDWPERGLEGYEHAQKCLRMSPDKALTNGFFVACFERKPNKKENYIELLNERAKRKREDEDVVKKKKKNKVTSEEVVFCVNEISECNEPLIRQDGQGTKINDIQENKLKSRKKKKKDKERCSDNLKTFESSLLSDNNQSQISVVLNTDSTKQSKTEKISKPKKHKQANFDDHAEEHVGHFASKETYLDSKILSENNKKNKKHKKAKKNKI